MLSFLVLLAEELERNCGMIEALASEPLPRR
jgi:hypothetical protein